jgi:hypothetical protein
LKAVWLSGARELEVTLDYMEKFYLESDVEICTIT